MSLKEAVVSPTPVVPMPSTHSVNLLLASANYPTASAAPNPQRPKRVVQETCVKSRIQKAEKGNKKTELGSKMATEDNGNVGLLKPTSSSNEDLSEYTDADESISAPTEFLAEFLSAVMLKDYETALKYCKLILQYEPNNATAKEFYPLIVEKLNQLKNEEQSSNGSEEDEDDTSSSSSGSGSDSSSDDSSGGQEEEEEVEIEINKKSKSSSDGDGTTGSYSSLEDDEIETDQLTLLAAKYQIDNVNLGNGNKLLNTTIFTANANINQANFINTNASDSESPTEPVTQQTIAMLRAKVVPTNN